MSEIKSDKVKVLAPVGNAIKFVAEETKLASILHRGVIVLRDHELYLKLAKKMALENSQEQIIPQIDILLKDAPGLGKEAEEISQNDFELVNRHAFISIWAAFESALEDTIFFLLAHSDRPIEDLAVFGVAYKKPSFERTDQNIASQVRRIEQAARKKHKSNIGKTYAWIFAEFDLRINQSRINEVILEEANAVRNCILHNSGVVDERAAQVSSLSTLIGQELRVTKSKYLQYYQAVSQFLTGLLEAICSSSYIRS